MNISLLGWQSWSDTRRPAGSYPQRYFSPFHQDNLINYHPVRSKPQRRTAPTGWCSWHYFGTHITEQIILNQIKAAAELGLEFILIDDGWTTWGDWLFADKNKFPHGLKWLVKKIKLNGLKAGLWWAPLLAKSSSGLFHQHPDWFVQNLEGTQVSPLDIFIPDKRRILDLENPGVIAYLNQVLDYFSDSGFELLKSDFLYAAHFNPKFTSGAVPDNLLKRLLSTVHRRSFYSIACGCPLVPAIGVVDAIRISDDINIPQLNHLWPLNHIVVSQRISQLSANLESRLLTQPLWHLDPDAFISDPLLGINPSQSEKLVQLIQKSNGVIFLGDDLTSLTSPQSDLIGRLIN